MRVERQRIVDTTFPLASFPGSPRTTESWVGPGNKATFPLLPSKSTTACLNVCIQLKAFGSLNHCNNAVRFASVHSERTTSARCSVGKGRPSAIVEYLEYCSGWQLLQCKELKWTQIVGTVIHPKIALGVELVMAVLSKHRFSCGSV